MAVDGRLNFDTKIDTKGFNQGTRTISNGLGTVKSSLGKVAAAAAAAFSAKQLQAGDARLLMQTFPKYKINPKEKTI